MFAVKIEQTDFTTNPYFNITWETRDYYNYSNGTSSKARVISAFNFQINQSINQLTNQHPQIRSNIKYFVIKSLTPSIFQPQNTSEIDNSLFRLDSSTFRALHIWSLGTAPFAGLLEINILHVKSEWFPLPEVLISFYNNPHHNSNCFNKSSD